MHRVLADFSRWANKVLGGEDGKTLCWRAAMRWGDDCLFCRVVSFVLREKHHCADELTAQDIITRLKRK
jgi:hypothetical protein